VYPQGTILRRSGTCPQHRKSDRHGSNPTRNPHRHSPAIAPDITGHSTCSPGIGGTYVA
jgi:hypothetical protein